jgi:hypothetical protein
MTVTLLIASGLAGLLIFVVVLRICTAIDEFRTKHGIR